MSRWRHLPTFIKLIYKLAVLERFSFSRLTRVNTGGYCMVLRIVQCIYLVFTLNELLSQWITCVPYNSQTRKSFQHQLLLLSCLFVHNVSLLSIQLPLLMAMQ